MWALVAAALVVVPITGSVFTARSVAGDDADKSRQEFERSSVEVAAILQLAIQNEDSLVVHASAFFLDNPGTTNADFGRWLDSVQAFERDPELESAGFALIVTAEELPAYAARVTMDPPGPLAADGSFQVMPPGDRPYYCLGPAGRNRNAATVPPAGADYCADPALAEMLMTARDSGKGSYFPSPNADGSVWLGVQAPIYQGGVVPETTEARRKTLVGFFGVFLNPAMVLERALQGRTDTAVTLRYGDGFIDTQFSSGAALDGAQSFSVDMQNGWTVETFGSVASGSMWGNRNAVALLLAGVVLSVLLGVLFLVLATGRDRALRLVAERTAELHGAQARLVDSARQAGMAEIATNVLHNVGNVLNSVNVSADLVGQKVRESKAAGLAKAVSLMDDHASDLGEFLTTDARGKALPGYLAKLAATLAAERKSIGEELTRLTESVTHIKEIVSAQQSLAGVASVIEPVRISDLVEDSLRMAGTVGLEDVTVVREFPDVGVLSLDRHRIVLILVNLINNATQAMEHNTDRPRRLRLSVEVTAAAVSVSVTDNGKGISQDDLARVFVHGFTTHVAGHGFGLHSAALAASEIGGSLKVHSDGPGTGAMFTLTVPLVDRAVAA